MQCCRAIICLLSFIFQPPAICYFYSALVLHTLHPYSHYCVFMQGYFRVCQKRSSKEKREVAPAFFTGMHDMLQCQPMETVNIALELMTSLAMTTIPGACFNFTMSYVVACSIWCLACIRKAEVGKIRKDIFYMNHHPVSTRRQIASQGTGRASDKPSKDRHHLEAN